MNTLEWESLDILLVTGDAYIDHPSFGVPLLGRYLISCGYKVGILAQPAWKGEASKEAFCEMGRPRLFAGVTAGALDSMLAHYTSFKRKRSDDAYTPGGIAGARPDRAVNIYAAKIKDFFPNLPLLAGGIEASLRRVSHYDFWSDSLKPSLLFEAGLDLLVYGMGERQLLEAAERMDEALDNFGEEALKDKALLSQIWSGIDGTVRNVSRETVKEKKALCLPSHYEILKDKKKLIEATLLLEKTCHQGEMPLFQEYDEGKILWHEKPAKTLHTKELDALYSLPFTRKAHPKYKGKIPAEEMICTSITSHRGCAGGCSFCSLALHQGRRIASRSKKSIVKEVECMIEAREFEAKKFGKKAKKLSISDVGGPSANMWQAQCTKNDDKCSRQSCLTPAICKYFKSKQKECIALLKEVAKIPQVAHVRVASGVRFDMLLEDKETILPYTIDFTGGQLKVAPEHISPHVLDYMRKPPFKLFEKFIKIFYELCKKHDKKHFIVPYLLSAFPSCTKDDMHKLKKWLQDKNWQPEQIQCFIPTPGTLATAMYYAEHNTKNEKIIVAKKDADRREQHEIIRKKQKAKRQKTEGQCLRRPKGIIPFGNPSKYK